MFRCWGDNRPLPSLEQDLNHQVSKEDEDDAEDDHHVDLRMNLMFRMLMKVGKSMMIRLTIIDIIHQAICAGPHTNIMILIAIQIFDIVHQDNRQGVGP